MKIVYSFWKHRTRSYSEHFVPLSTIHCSLSLPSVERSNHFAISFSGLSRTAFPPFPAFSYPFNIRLKLPLRVLTTLVELVLVLLLLLFLFTLLLLLSLSSLLLLLLFEQIPEPLYTASSGSDFPANRNYITLNLPESPPPPQTHTHLPRL